MSNATGSDGVARNDRNDKVVRMDRFRSGRSLSPIKQAEAYWSALQNGTRVPRRSDLDPRGLENILEHTFILERIAPGVARFRLAGRNLGTLAGTELRGMPFCALFSGDSRSRIGAVLEHVFDVPAVAELTLAYKLPGGRRTVDARMILLPLESDLGDVSRILGVLVSDGDPDGPGTGFEIRDTELRDQDRPQRPDPAAVETAHGFAEEAAGFSRPHAHLRLVSSRD